MTTEYAKLHSPHRNETRLRAIAFLEAELRKAPRSEFRAIEQQLALLRSYETRELPAASTAAPRLTSSSSSVDVVGKSFGGYAAVFNSLSQDLGGFRETIKPGAFQSALRNSPDVKFLVDHDRNRMLARTSARTVTITEDTKGLRFRAAVPDTQLGRDVAYQVQRGDLSQCSFGFRVLKDSFSRLSTGVVRTITEFQRINDVSIVVDPAYESTSVSLRSQHELDAIESDSQRFAQLHKLNLTQPYTGLSLDAARRRLTLLELQHPKN